MQKVSQSKGQTMAWLLIAALAVIWGSSFILMKRGLVSLTFDQVAALRMFTAFLAVFPFAVSGVKQVLPHQWKFIALSGLLGNLIPAFLFPFAQTMIASNMAGMLNALTPVFVLLVGKWMFGIKSSRHAIAGVFIGLAGAIGLILTRSQGAIGSNSAYGLYIILACLCYGTSVNILRSKLHELNPIIITGFALMFAGVPSGIYLFNTDFLECALLPQSQKSLIAICILGVVGSGLSTVLFNKLIKNTSALAASSVTYLIPVVALIWGLYDHETMGVMHIISMLVILSGVYLINKKT
ncbi:MAG: EamA family transporter [Bacteroidia bacterium]|nr:EamA family transporter [Bacteroidia bacterium]